MIERIIAGLEEVQLELDSIRQMTSITDMKKARYDKMANDIIAARMELANYRWRTNPEELPANHIPVCGKRATDDSIEIVHLEQRPYPTVNPETGKHATKYEKVWIDSNDTAWDVSSFNAWLPMPEYDYW